MSKYAIHLLLATNGLPKGHTLRRDTYIWASNYILDPPKVPISLAKIGELSSAKDNESLDTEPLLFDTEEEAHDFAKKRKWRNYTIELY